MQKNLQYLAIAFPDGEDFEAWNAKFLLHLVLAFSNANALIKLYDIIDKVTFKMVKQNSYVKVDVTSYSFNLINVKK